MSEAIYADGQTITATTYHNQTQQSVDVYRRTKYCFLQKQLPRFHPQKSISIDGARAPMGVINYEQRPAQIPYVTKARHHTKINHITITVALFSSIKVFIILDLCSHYIRYSSVRLLNIDLSSKCRFCA